MLPAPRQIGWAVGAGKARTLLEQQSLLLGVHTDLLTCTCMKQAGMQNGWRSFCHKLAALVGMDCCIIQAGIAVMTSIHRFCMHCLACCTGCMPSSCLGKDVDCSMQFTCPMSTAMVHTPLIVACSVLAHPDMLLHVLSLAEHSGPSCSVKWVRPKQPAASTSGCIYSNAAHASHPVVYSALDSSTNRLYSSG